MRTPVGFGPRSGCLAALAAVVMMAAAGGQAAHAGGIGVVGGAQIVPDGPGVGPLVEVAAFTAPDGRSYLLALGYDSIHTINVADPLDPVLTGGIARDWFVDLWFWGADVFYPPDGRVYAATTGGGFVILDVTDPAKPEVVDGAPAGAGSLHPAFGDTRQVAVHERPDGRVHALVTGGDGDLRAVDITDPHNPVILGGGPGRIPAVSGDGAAFLEPGDGRTYMVYVNHWTGVLIADVTDPARHALISAIRHHDGDHPLWSEDLFGAHGIPEPSSSDILIADGYAEGLRHAREVAVFGSPDGHTYAMVANDMTTIRIGESDPYRVPAGITFLDITDPHVPAPAGAILDGEGGFDLGSGIRDIAILESPGGRVHAVVAGGQGVIILDVTDPAGPIPVSHIRDGEGGFDAVDVVGGMAVVESPNGRIHLATAGDEGIQMADVTDPGAPAPAGSIPNRSAAFGNPAIFGAGGGRAYAVGVGVDAVSIVDITDPRLPAPLGSIRDGEGGFDTLDGVRRAEVLRAHDGRIYVMAAGREGLQVVDVTDPTYPAAAGVLRNGTGGFDVAGWIISTAVLRQPHDGRDYLLVADHGRGIHVVDVTDPGSPVPAGSLPGGEGGIDLLGGIHDIDIFFGAPDGHPYALMTGDRGIHTIDMADPTAPMVVGTIDGAINGTVGGHGLAAAYQSTVFESAGGRVYALVADSMTGIHVIDLTDPRLPEHAGSAPTGVEGGIEVIPGSPVAAVASPDGRAWALVAGREDVQVLEITDPRLPALADVIPAGEGGLGLERTPWDITTLEPAGGRVHILASGGDRLWVLDATYPVSPAIPYTGGWDREGILGQEGGPAWMVVPGPAGDMAITESPDGRVYAILADPAGGLLAVEAAGPDAADGPGFWRAGPGKAGWPPAVLDGPTPGPAVELFRPHDGRTYMMMGSGDAIWVVDVTYPHSPAPAATIRDNLGGFYSLGGIGGISAFASPDGRVLALAGGSDGIQVMDVTNPYSPAPAGSIRDVPGIPAREDIRRIAAVPMPDGRVVALAADESGRAGMLDVTDPRLPVPAGIMPPAEGAGPILYITPFWTSDGHVHVLLAGEYTSRVIDVTDPGDPVVVAVFDDAAAPEGPQDADGDGGPAGVTIRAGSSDPECTDGDGCYFIPRTVTIGVGDTVTWINGDDVAHGLVGMLDDADGAAVPAFSVFGLLPGEEFSHRFVEAGEYRYFGVPHPWMTGRVVVAE